MATPVHFPPRLEIDANARELTRLGYRSASHAERVLIRLGQRLRSTPKPDEDDIICDIEVQGLRHLGLTLTEIAMGKDVSEFMHGTAHRLTRAKGEYPWQKFVEDINEIAERHGSTYGIPLPPHNDPLHPMVLADGVPLAKQIGINQNLRTVERAQQRASTESELMLRLRNAPVRNSWHVLGDQTVTIIDTTQGPYAWIDWDAGMRLRKIVHTAELRSATHLTAEAELRALESLKGRVQKGQYESYVLNGVFPEHSKRSDLFYFFRKGLPTIVISYHGEKAKDGGRVLAALCLHPMGYYVGTHCGLMTPTDEVIAQLLLMRSDERRYWAKSGQWAATDSRSGI